jgi:hypothetical protein
MTTKTWTHEDLASEREAERSTDYLLGVDPKIQAVVRLAAQLSEARAMARILAHAYTHDARPPQIVFDTIKKWGGDGMDE